MNQNPKKRRQQEQAVEGDRLPPHAGEAEEVALGCILSDAEKAGEMLNQCEEAGVSADWFYDLRNQTLWGAMAGMHKAGQKVDLVTVFQWLRDHGQLEDAGGMERVTQMNEGGGPFLLDQYLGILWEHTQLRAVVRAGAEMVAGAYSIEEGEKTRASELVSRAERELQRLAEGSGSHEIRIKPAIEAAINDLEDYHRGRAQVRGLTTGLEYVDKLLCGIGGANGNYIVISARPNTGKTALALDLAEHAALDYVWWEPVLDEQQQPVTETIDGVDKVKAVPRRGIPVGVFSLEMTAEALAHRMLFTRARADMQRWRTGFATNADFPPLTKAAVDLCKANNIWIDDSARCTMESIKAKARRWHRQYGVRLFIIDYIQLLRSSTRRFREDRVQELAEISGDIQGLGKELNCPIVVLAQMNRDYEKEPNRRPRLSDLKDCGSIEQDADLVGFLYEPKLKEGAEETYESAALSTYGQDWSRKVQRIDLLFAKNRHGPTGNCQLLFQKWCTHFADYNVWLKTHGHMEPAAGEGAMYSKDLPSNEELGL